MLRFFLAPLVDGYHGLSLTRLLAVATMAVVWMTAFHEHTLTWVMFWMVLASLAAAFGKGVFVKLLGDVKLGVSGSEAIARTDAHVTIDETVKTITDRRGDLDYEPAP